MLVTVLPFFLAAHIAIDPHRQTEWVMNGAECTFDVLVNMSLSNIVRVNDNFCAMIATELKCRAQGEDILNCRFQNSRIKRLNPQDTGCTNAKDFVPTRYKFVGDEPFEIRFNSRGIENLVVHRTIPQWRLDMVKMIASQLNIGFSLPESRPRFTIMENSTVGQCEVEVRISHGKLGLDEKVNDEDNYDDDDSNEDMDYKLDLVASSGGRNLEKVFRVEKARHPKNCPRRTIYFFGNHEDYSRGDKELYMDMTTSISHIEVSKNTFKSYTISEGVMITTNKTRIMKPRQKISLELKRISLARGPLPEIPDPASTSLFAFMHPEAVAEDV